MSFFSSKTVRYVSFSSRWLSIIGKVTFLSTVIFSLSAIWGLTGNFILSTLITPFLSAPFRYEFCLDIFFAWVKLPLICALNFLIEFFLLLFLLGDVLYSVYSFLTSTVGYTGSNYVILLAEVRPVVLMDLSLRYLLLKSGAIYACLLTSVNFILGVVGFVFCLIKLFCYVLIYLERLLALLLTLDVVLFSSSFCCSLSLAFRFLKSMAYYMGFKYLSFVYSMAVLSLSISSYSQ